MRRSVTTNGLIWRLDKENVKRQRQASASAYWRSDVEVSGVEDGLEARFSAKIFRTLAYSAFACESESMPLSSCGSFSSWTLYPAFRPNKVVNTSRLISHFNQEAFC